MGMEHTCVSARAWSINVLASAVRPLMAHPICSSISMIFSMLLGSCGNKDHWGVRCSERRALQLHTAGLLSSQVQAKLTRSTEVTRFSTASTTPSFVATPMAVLPSLMA